MKRTLVIVAMLFIMLASLTPMAAQAADQAAPATNYGILGEPPTLDAYQRGGG